ncbi:MAG: C40 family peptidase [Flavobacteriales bacterium]|nr:C40 family peptidase [Flavobacteriales bacterium]MDW8410031.1 C40 family peptidase [Flavobacteriales bacterium]
MERGVCLFSVVPVRAEPRHQAEQVSQLLFGETYQCLPSQDLDWLSIRCDWDGYEGFIPLVQHTPLTENDYQNLQTVTWHTAYRLVSRVEDLESGITFPVLRGSTLYAQDGEIFAIGERRFILHEESLTHRPTDPLERMIDFAFTYLNAPYQWGGRSPFGIDCSGFVQVVFKSAGIRLPRDTWQQMAMGSPVDNAGEACPGDLVFFTGKDSQVSHVGLIYDEQKVIHASGFVKVGMLSDSGLWDPLLRQTTHRLHSIRRVTRPVFQ